MTLLSEILLDAAAKFPAQRRGFERLNALINHSNGRIEFTFERLLELLEPVSSRELIVICTVLVGNGLLETLFRLRVPGSGPIADYSDVNEIPDEIRDHFTDNVVDVTPDIISVIYLVRGRK